MVDLKRPHAVILTIAHDLKRMITFEYMSNGFSKVTSFDLLDFISVGRFVLASVWSAKIPFSKRINRNDYTLYTQTCVCFSSIVIKSHFIVTVMLLFFEGDLNEIHIRHMWCERMCFFLLLIVQYWATPHINVGPD